MAGLTGTPSLFLLPLFVHAAWAARDRRLWQETAALGVAGVAQACVLATSSGVLQAGRGFEGGVGLVPLAVLVKSVALPFAGVGVADRLGTALAGLLSADPVAFAALGAVSGAAELTALALLAKGGTRPTGWYLAAACLLLAVPSALFALGPKAMLLTARGDQRYLYGPNVLVMLLLLANLPRAWPILRAPWPRGLCAAALATTLLVSGVSYGGALYTHPSWPPWREEILRWRADPSHTITIWPGWTFNLDP